MLDEWRVRTSRRNPSEATDRWLYSYWSSSTPAKESKAGSLERLKSHRVITSNLDHQYIHHVSKVTFAMVRVANKGPISTCCLRTHQFFMACIVDARLAAIIIGLITADAMIASMVAAWYGYSSPDVSRSLLCLGMTFSLKEPKIDHRVTLASHQARRV